MMDKLGVGRVASVSGRYYAMDRDNRWDRVELAYRALVNGEGKTATDPLELIQSSYDENVNDEFVVPTVITENGMPIATISNEDSVIFFNFRPDRARELTRALCDDEFSGFSRGERVKTFYVCFTEYDVTIPNKEVAFHKVAINNTFGEFLADNGLKQARIAETEKYAHVTFFFNGGIEKPNKGEDRILVNSPKVATYDLKPEMSAYEVCDKLVEAIESEKYDVIIINFANPDMVGHTGIIPAAITACEAVDANVARVLEAVLASNGRVVVTADHGNVEEMIDASGQPMTAHSTNKVALAVLDNGPVKKLKEGGKLGDVAPTILRLWGLDLPSEMTGESLLLETK
jgi:2,3-bisphosphoglycerate-independent phosphoglycerate mutase